MSKVVEVDSMNKLFRDTQQKYSNYLKEARGRRPESTELRMSRPESSSSSILNKSPKPKEYTPLKNSSQQRSVSPADRKIFNLSKETKDLKTNLEAVEKERDVLKAWKANALKSPQSVQPVAKKTIRELEVERENLLRKIKIGQDKQKFLIRGVQSFILFSSRIQKFLRKEEALKYSGLFEDEKHKLEMRIKDVENEQASNKWSAESSPWITPNTSPFRTRNISKHDDVSVEEFGYSKDVNFLQDELAKQIESTQKLQKKFDEEMQRRSTEEDKLKAKLSDMDEIEKMLTAENAKLEKESDSLRVQLIASRQKSDSQPAVKFDYIKQSNERNGMKSRIEELETFIQEKNKLISQLQEKIGDFEKFPKLNELTKKWVESQINDSSKSLNGQIINIKNMLFKQDEHISSLENQLKQKLKENLEALQAMNEEVGRRSDEGVIERLTQEKDHIQYMMEQNQAYQDTAIQEMAETIEMLEKERDLLNKEISSSERIIKELEEKNEIILELEKDITEYKVRQKEHEKIQQEYRILLQKEEQKDIHLEQAKYEISVVQNENRILTDANADKDKQIMNLEKKLQDQIISANISIEGLEFKLRSIESKLNSKNLEIENLNEVYQSVVNDYNVSQNLIIFLQSKLTQCDKENEIKGLQEFEDSKKETVILKGIRDELQNEISKLKMEAELSVQDKAHLTNQLNEENLKISYLEKCLDQKETKVQEIERLFEKSRNDLLKSIEKDEIIIKQLENQLSEERKNSTDLSIKLSVCESQISQIQKSRGETAQNFELKILDLESQINDYKLHHQKEVANIKSQNEILIKMLEDRLIQLDNQNHEQSDELTKLTTQIIEKDKQISELKSKINSIEYNLSELYKEKNDLEKENVKLADEICIKSNELEKTKTKSVLDEDKTRGNDLQISQLIDTCENLKSELVSKNLMIQDFERKSKSLEGCISESIENAKKMADEYQKLKFEQQKEFDDKNENLKQYFENAVKNCWIKNESKCENLNQLMLALDNKLKSLKKKVKLGLERNLQELRIMNEKSMEKDEEAEVILNSKIEHLEFTLSETQAWSDSKIKELEEQIESIIQEKEELLCELQQQKDEISKVPL